MYFSHRTLQTYHLDFFFSRHSLQSVLTTFSSSHFLLGFHLEVPSRGYLFDKAHPHTTFIILRWMIYSYHTRKVQLENNRRIQFISKKFKTYERAIIVLANNGGGKHLEKQPSLFCCSLLTIKRIQRKKECERIIYNGALREESSS